MRVAIEGHSHLTRETGSMAVINKDTQGRQQVLARRQALKDKDTEIADLKEQISQLWEIVNKLAAK